MLLRLLFYGCLGWVCEILWTAIYSFYRSYRDPTAPREFRTERWRLTGRTYLWMFPLYGATALFLERAHDRLRPHSVFYRGLFYVTVCFAVEYAAGFTLRRLTGRCPWDYSWARVHLHGLIRPDYAPVWLFLGLAFEQVHDVLVRAGPSLILAIHGP